MMRPIGNVNLYKIDHLDCRRAGFFGLNFEVGRVRLVNPAVGAIPQPSYPTDFDLCTQICDFAAAHIKQCEVTL